MQVNLKRVNDSFLFEGKSKTGATVSVDNSSEPDAAGASPMELLLMGVGGCSAIDIVYILKKQRQTIDDYAMQVTGERYEKEQAKPFKSIHVKVILSGTIQPEKAKRAAQLSFEKYCSVSLTMEPNVAVSYSIVLNGEVLE